MADVTAGQRQLAEMIRDSEFCVALTGAGISVPSGIPDFRSEGGLWSEVDPQEVCTIDVWATDPEKFWRFYRDRLDIPASFEPNGAHRALVSLEKAGSLQGLITQNIDGLHQKAGAAAVIEIHGSVRKLVCPCGAEFAREVSEPLFRENGVPYCPECAAAGDHEQPLKPDVVLFGEMLSEYDLGRCYALAYNCDLMICVGSSLVVEPVCSLPRYAQEGGARLAVISKSSAYDEHCDVHLDGDVESELEGVLAALSELQA